MFAIEANPGAHKMALWVKMIAKQAWWPEFEPQNPYKGKTEKRTTLQLPSDLHELTVACTLPPTNK